MVTGLVHDPGYFNAHNRAQHAENAQRLSLLGEFPSGIVTPHRLATDSELLARRDELMLAGWDESDSESLPHIVRELARAAFGKTFAIRSLPCHRYCRHQR